jgi:hypothetical protein
MLEMSTIEPLNQVYLQYTVYDPPSLPLSSLEPGGKLIHYIYCYFSLLYLLETSLLPLSEG